MKRKGLESETPPPKKSRNAFEKCERARVCSNINKKHALLLQITESLLETEAVVMGSINTNATIETVCLSDCTHQLNSLLAIFTVAETSSEQCMHSSSSGVQ